MGHRSWRSLRFVTWLALLAVAAGMTACGGSGAGVPGGQEDAGGGTAGKVRVVATFYPLAFMARAVGGDRVEVTELVPPGTEPHDWEPRPSDVRTVQRARVFIYNGAGFEPWVDRVLKAAGHDGLITVNASEGIELLPVPAGGSGGHGGPAGDAAGHGRAGAGHAGSEGASVAYDPHVWVDPHLSQQQVRNVVEGLIRANPEGEAVYRANARRLMERLADLDRRYRELASCPRREIVVSHAFFTYPAKRYGLRQVTIYGNLAPGSEPSPRQMAELAQFIRSRGIRHIFVEPLVNDRAAQVLAAETGAQLLVLNPLEGLTAQDRAAGRDFLALMEQNLHNLRVALGCDAR
ncbi:MAG: metal ABC transporter substrate-binding protein [Symbiobacteriaceae bacterium]